MRALTAMISFGKSSTRGPSHRPAMGTCRRDFLLGCGQQAFTLCLFALELPYSPNCLIFFARRSLRRFFVKALPLHLAEDPFALQSSFQYPERLIDVVVANEYLQNVLPFLLTR